MDRPENRKARPAQSDIRRISLRSWRFNDEPQDHRRDPERDRADPQSTQNFPHLYPASPPAQQPVAAHVPRRTQKVARRLRQKSFGSPISAYLTRLPALHSSPSDDAAGMTTAVLRGVRR